MQIDLDKSDPERLLRYYFGGYASAAGADPFEAGLLVARDGAFFVDLDALEGRQAENALRDADGSGRIEWEELEAFVHATYYDARQVPSTAAALHARAPYREGGWFEVEVDGVMTKARRRLFVAEDALRAALRTYQDNGEQLLYPSGTVIVGEHYVEGTHVETTAMLKRGDGFWDFATYGPDGALAFTTHTGPRDLKTPTQCVGCHFGKKQFDPEKSFPGEARPGPHGPRALHVTPQARDAGLVRFFDEHRKRSDTVLGLYGTLFIAHLQAQQRAGELSEEDARLLEGLIDASS